MLRATRTIARPSVTIARRFVGGQVRPEGSVAQSSGFSKKEKAHEDQYVHDKEVEKLRKLRATIDEAKKELAEVDAGLSAQEAKKP
ncbi:hypothetical protein BKA62DRAFT_696025 [Auriculariales sp. MPI-PUGE-AT-0066]|nr:hypothetical protein BKA62DRAFT_696025 [Auriculariales sp. MPI-PUGE-AT-0066]